MSQISPKEEYDIQRHTGEHRLVTHLASRMSARWFGSRVPQHRVISCPAASTGIACRTDRLDTGAGGGIGIREDSPAVQDLCCSFFPPVDFNQRDINPEIAGRHEDAFVSQVTDGPWRSLCRLLRHGCFHESNGMTFEAADRVSPRRWKGRIVCCAKMADNLCRQLPTSRR